MTTIYFVRHAESDSSIRDGKVRPLTKKGLEDAKNLVTLFQDIELDRIYSSPYKRAVDTVFPLATSRKLDITVIDDFRERRSDIVQTIGMAELIQMQWNDFTYTLSDGECLRDVQLRNMNALRQVLSENDGKNAVIGTHGMALCTMMHFYQPMDLENLRRILLTMPYVTRMTFDGYEFVSMEEL